MQSGLGIEYSEILHRIQYYQRLCRTLKIVCSRLNDQLAIRSFTSQSPECGQEAVMCVIRTYTVFVKLLHSFPWPVTRTGRCGFWQSFFDGGHSILVCFVTILGVISHIHIITVIFFVDRDTPNMYDSSSYGRGTLSVLLDNVYCNGNERSIFDCTHSPVGQRNCYYYEDAGVNCFPNILWI